MSPQDRTLAVMALEYSGDPEELRICAAAVSADPPLAEQLEAKALAIEAERTRIADEALAAATAKKHRQMKRIAMLWTFGAFAWAGATASGYAYADRFDDAVAVVTMCALGYVAGRMGGKW